MPSAIAPASSTVAASALPNAFWRRWAQIWFQPRPTTPIEITRIGLGLALLLNYGLASPYIFLLWGDDGWVPRSLLGQVAQDPLEQSVLFYLTAPWQQALFHALFVAACA